MKLFCRAVTWVPGSLALLGSAVICSRNVT